MNAADFNRWWQDFGARCPSRAAWIERQQDPQAVLRTWRETFLDLDVRHMLEVNRRIQVGVAELPEHDWDSTPRVLRDMALRVGYEEELFACRVGEPDLPRREWQECALCQDSGMVAVYSGEQVQAVADGVLVGEPLRRKLAPRYVVVCSCPCGRRYAATVVRSRQGATVAERPRYDRSTWCRRTLNNDRHEATIRQWLSDRRREVTP